MAFPTIPTVAAGRILYTLNTTGGATKTFPNLSSLTKNAGDLLLAICVEYDGNSTDAEFSSWGGSFTEIADRAGTATMAIGVAWKISTGSETGTFTVTTADTSTNDSVMILMSIPGVHATLAPEVSVMTTSAAAPPAVGTTLNPTNWDVAETLWIAVGGSGETATTGSYTGMASAPTNYTDYSDSGITADVVGGVEAAVAFRQLAAASEAPGAWGGDTSNARGAALVIAVPPFGDVDITTTTVSGATTVPTPSVTTEPPGVSQPHFRIRSDDSQTLNADAGWAAALDTNATIDAEKVFRIRFEVSTAEAPGSRTYKLQYRRNAGTWTDVEVNLEVPPLEVDSTEILLSSQYVNDDATTNLLSGSGLGFTAGVGLEDNLTPAISLNNQHTEYEWTLRIRLSYGESTLYHDRNADGDTFEYRIVDSASGAFAGTYTNPTVTLNVPDYLIGGTFSETANQVGPIGDANGNLYLIHEVADTSSYPWILKSTDGGRQWTAQDTANAPTNDDLESADIIQVGNTLHVIANANYEIYYHTFRTSDHGTPDTWGVVDQLIHNPAVDPGNQFSSGAVRSDGTVVAVYRTDPSGADERIGVRVRSTGGTWSSEQILDTTASVSFSAAVAVTGEADLVYIFYVDLTNGALYYKTLSTGDVLSARTQIATGLGTSTSSQEHTVRKPVYYDDGGDEVIVVVYAKSTDILWAAPIVNGTPGTELQVSGVAAGSNDNGSSGPTAAVGVDGKTVYVAYADDATKDIWLDSNNDQAGWGTDVEIANNVTCRALSGSVFTHSVGNGGKKVFGYFYDASASGTTGELFYGEFELPGDVNVTAGNVQATTTVDTPNVQASGDVNITTTTVQATTTIPTPTVEASSGVACELVAVIHDTAGSPHTTAAFSPAAGDLLVCFWYAAGMSDGTEATAAASSTGNTASWDQVDFVDITTAGNQGKAFCFIQTALTSAVSTTVTVTNTADQASGTHVWVYRISGMTKTGSTAKKQSCEDNEHAAGTPAATGFGSAVLTSNPTLLFLHDEGTATGYTAPTGWTEPTSPASEGIITVPTSRGVSAFRDGGFTGTTITWGTASTGVYGHYGIELDASGSSPDADITTTTVEATTSIDTPAVATDANLTTTSVASTTSVDTPVVAANADVTTTTVASTTSVDTPAIATDANLTTVTVAATTTVSTPTTNADANLTTTSVASTTSVDTPVVAANADVTTTTVAAVTFVPTPVVEVAGDANVTAGDVSLTTSVPTPAIATDANLTTTAIASTTVVDTPTVAANADVTTTTVVVTAFIDTPAMATDANLTIGNVASTTSVPTPEIGIGVDVTTTTVAAVTFVPTPAIATDANLTTITVAATTTVDTPVVSIGGDASITTTTVAAQASVDTPTLNTDANLTTTAVSATTTIDTPTVQANADITTSTIVAVDNIFTPAIATDANLTVGNVSAPTFVDTPTVTGDANAVAGTVAASTTVDTPSVTVSGNVDITTVTVASQTFVDTPTVAGDANVTAGNISTTTTVPTPLVETAGNVNVEAGNIAAVTFVPTPSVANDSNLTLTTVSATTAVNTPTTAADANVTVGNVLAQTSIAAPTIAGNADVTSITVAGQAQIFTPTFVISADVVAGNIFVQAFVPTAPVIILGSGDAAPEAGPVQAVTSVSGVVISTLEYDWEQTSHTDWEQTSHTDWPQDNSTDWPQENSTDWPQGGQP